VAEVETLEPTAVEEMTNSGYALTLFTCTYGGQSRVTVRCDLVDCIIGDATE
jgi:sortase A